MDHVLGTLDPHFWYNHDHYDDGVGYDGDDDEIMMTMTFVQVYSSLHGPQLIGIVSNGAESCMGGLPGIFTRVSRAQS